MVYVFTYVVLVVYWSEPTLLFVITVYDSNSPVSLSVLVLDNLRLKRHYNLPAPYWYLFICYQVPLRPTLCRTATQIQITIHFTV